MEQQENTPDSEFERRTHVIPKAKAAMPLYIGATALVT